MGDVFRGVKAQAICPAPHNFRDLTLVRCLCGEFGSKPPGTVEVVLVEGEKERLTQEATAELSNKAVAAQDGRMDLLYESPSRWLGNGFLFTSIVDALESFAAFSPPSVEEEQ